MISGCPDLPAGRAPLEASAAPLWTGADLDDSYRIDLDARAAHEAVAALLVLRDRFSGRDPALDRGLCADDFPLPTLAPVLADLVAQVADGRGFALLRGLPITGLDDGDCALLLRGLAAHLAPIATQSRDGQLIRHVRATGAALGNAVTRGHQTSERLYFHTDGADAAVLLCRVGARTGGLSRLASAAHVHNTMLARRPDLVELLYGRFHFHMAGGNTPGCPPTFISPIFSLHRQRFSTRYVRHTLLETPHVTGVALPAPVLEAFDLLEQLADESCVEMELQPGDLQIVNNHTVLHSRTAYQDNPAEPGTARHLLRCWLTLPGYAGRRSGPVDEGLRHGWLTDQLQRDAAGSWTAPGALA